MTRTFCDACEEQIHDGDYCDGHRAGCRNYHGYVDDVACDCDMHYHTECCPVCNAMEYAAEAAEGLGL